MKQQHTHNVITDVQKISAEQEIQELLFGPEREIINNYKNPFLDRLLLEIELRDGKSRISDVIRTEPRIYEAIFHKAWFYRLADMLGLNRILMDKYVKPKCVREFFIQFVYARLSYQVFRELKAARTLAKAYDAKLFQFLKDDYYNLIELIALEIYQEMEGKGYNQFVESYCKKNRLPIQQVLDF